VSGRRTGAALLLVGLTLVTAAAEPPSVPAGPEALLGRLEAAWKAHDVEGYLSLWSFDDAARTDEERAFALNCFSAERSELDIQRPDAFAQAKDHLAVGVQIFTSTEPRARFEQWVFTLESRHSGWVLVKREARGEVEGLVHLSLDAAGYRADGLSFHFEDFELNMQHGTLFSSPATVGPTAFVFVGEGTVRFHPAPPSEREQLRLFAGAPELVERIDAAFLRIHPADLHHVLSPVRLETDPHAARRYGSAADFFRDQVSRAFVLDANLPGSPWLLLPGLGDSLATFKTAHHGTLTLSVNSGDAEGVSLFDRARRRQICQYPAAGRGIDYDEDDGRTVDLLHHNLSVRLEPERNRVVGRDNLRLRVLLPTPWIQLRLSEALNVDSVSSTAGHHLFFRVRNQDTVMISLGPWAGAVGELSLDIRYSGTLRPEAVEHEALQSAPGLGAVGPDERPGLTVAEMNIERVLTYTNRNAWYPGGGSDDSADADLLFDVPAGYTVVAGGERVMAESQGQRELIQYHQALPGRYISIAVGRLIQVEERKETLPVLRGFGVVRTRAEVHENLDQARAMLSFFADQFGPCPYPSLNLVMIEGLTPGGHSPPGMVILSRRPPLLRTPLAQDPANFSDVPGFFLAHELAHQWWGHGVAGKNYHERWLSEGFAQYAAALWVRKSRGEKAFHDVLDRFAGWAFRGNAAGPISLGNRLGRVTEDPQALRAVVYDKGAYVLHMLRGRVGDDAFRQGLRALQEKHRFQKVGTSDLEAALEAASGRDLAPYFQAWFSGTTLPRLTLLKSAEGGRRTLVEVKAEGLPGPVPLLISVHHETGTTTNRVELPPEGGRFTIDTPSRAHDVEINDDGGLLAHVEG
jgi:hypothetical protein